MADSSAARAYPRPEQYYFDTPLYGCLCCQTYDASWRACLVQSCCCSLAYAHCLAIEWIADDLGERAEGAFGAAVVAAALKTLPAVAGVYIFDSMGRRSGGFVRSEPLIHLAQTQAEIQSNLIAGALRRDIIRRLYGVWQRRTYDEGENRPWLLLDPTRGQGCAIFCAQCCCPLCARCQEIDAAMRWRAAVTGKEVRFANPCLCRWGFEEEWHDDVWVIPLGIDPAKKLNLDADVLYARKLPDGPTPPIMLRL